MIVAGLGARARPLPDGAENCALLMACASSAGVAACEAPRLAACEAPRFAASAASATINAAQNTAALSPRAQQPIRNVPGIWTTLKDGPRMPMQAARRQARSWLCQNDVS